MRIFRVNNIACLKTSPACGVSLFPPHVYEERKQVACTDSELQHESTGRLFRARKVPAVSPSMKMKHLIIWRGFTVTGHLGETVVLKVRLTCVERLKEYVKVDNSVLRGWPFHQVYWQGTSALVNGKGNQNYS